MPIGIFTLKQQVKALQQMVWPGTKVSSVNYLVVAGGGGGGASNPGGGGAGGLLTGVTSVTPGSPITVTIGAGGNGTSGTTIPGNGTNSVFGSVVATGGGAGANNTTGGAAGGSGGGSGPSSASDAIPGQGVLNQGGRGGLSLSSGSSGGGGGAGMNGVNGGPSSTHGGNGGAGVAVDISGTRTAYAGGGGGYSTNVGAGVSGGFGGAGGGGASSNQSGSGNAQSGTANTGGGGGSAPNYTGGSGGSGIVIISYPDTYAAAASTTGSPTVSTSGSGNLSFNGSSQTVSTAASSLLALGSGSFTIEYWVKINGSGSFSRTFLITGTSSVSIESNTYTSAVTPYYLNYGGTQTAITTGSSFDVTQWHHVAIVRNGTNLRVYLNGVQAMSVTDSTNYSSNGTLYIGSNNSANWLNGYVTNFRLVKGTAVYTAAFTPPTAPLAAISNTSILVSAVSGSFLADSSGNGFTFTNTGSTPWNSDSPFATGLGYKNRVYTWTGSGSITF